MALPPLVSENFVRFYGSGSIYRPYAFAATFFFLLFLKRDSRRMGVLGLVCTLVAFYVSGFIGDAFVQFAPPTPKPAKSWR